jgi:hypothetical protein
MIAGLGPLQFTVRTLNGYTGLLPSLIVWDFPEILAGFRSNRFALLWWGSRDGFGWRDFHNRCEQSVQCSSEEILVEVHT